MAVSVTDSGLGIVNGDREKVFDSQFIFTGGGIAGLGDPNGNLAAVRELAQASGGEVGFESYPGEGTTFTLQLPVVEVLSTNGSALASRPDHPEPIAPSGTPAPDEQ
jgi:signal transduction histidine kinase